MSASQHENQVTIGQAFGRWRKWKLKKGLKSDEAVAVRLLETAKTSRSSSPSSQSTSKRMKFSKAEVQVMIKREVNSALKESTDELQSLTETVQKMDSGVDYESLLQNLETRINTITQRAEAAFTFISKKKNKDSFHTSVQEIFGSDSEGEDGKISRCTDSSMELLQATENLEAALREMQANKEALMAAAAHQDEEPPPPLVAPPRSPEVERIQNQQPTPPPPEQQGVENTKRGDALARNLQHGAQRQGNSAVPPLPSLAVPSSLTACAASYNFPQKVQVHLAFIRNPPGLAVLWSVAEEDPSAPPMDCYRVYISMEKGKGSSIFSDWSVIGELKALPLPMCIIIKKYQPGFKLCFAVVGKDVFGRYGPYSEVVVAEKSE